MTRTRRTLPLLLTLLVFAATLVVGTATSAPRVHAATLSTTATAVECQEDQACWNSCTMGNLSPCDLSAVLPDGAWFRVEVTPVTRAGAECAPGRRPATVTVLAVAAPEGVTVLARQAVVTCAATGDNPLDDQAARVLPGLFAVVGSQL